MAAIAIVEMIRNAPTTIARAPIRSGWASSRRPARRSRERSGLRVAQRIHDDRPGDQGVGPADGQCPYRAERHHAADERAPGHADQEVDDDHQQNRKLGQPQAKHEPRATQHGCELAEVGVPVAKKGRRHTQAASRGRYERDGKDPRPDRGGDQQKECDQDDAEEDVGCQESPRVVVQVDGRLANATAQLWCRRDATLSL